MRRAVGTNRCRRRRQTQRNSLHVFRVSSSTRLQVERVGWCPPRKSIRDRMPDGVQRGGDWGSNPKREEQSAGKSLDAWPKNLPWGGLFWGSVVEHPACPSGTSLIVVKRAAVGIKPGTTRAKSEYCAPRPSGLTKKMGNDREDRSSESRIRELEGHGEYSWWITQGVIFEGGVSQFCLYSTQ